MANSEFNLSDLNGENGFIINGIDEGDLSGFSVSSAGDVSGDSLDDLIIGARGADPNGDGSGQSYVVFGSKNPSSSLNLSDLDGNNGFTINAVDAGDLSGYSVSSAGDVNGDGLDDLVIGAYDADPNGNSSGQSYVVFGSDDPASSINLGDLDGTNGFTINGIDTGDRSGFSVSGAGDVNGDGLDDIIIGADSADSNGEGSGQSYVVFGSNNPSSSLNLGDLDGTNGFIINGIDAIDLSGRSVSSAGDVNGDGFSDLIIGASGGDSNGSASGESYVVFGSDNPGSSLDLGDLDGTNGFTINGVDASDLSGRSVNSAGDVNGDGFSDLIIGAYNADPSGSNSGESYVVFGSKIPSSNLNLGDLDGTNGFIINGIDEGDLSGFSVSSAGDVNDDGFDDLIIGASGGDPNGTDGAGESYVVFGSKNPSSSLNLGDLDGANGFILNGIDADDRSGWSVSGAGDVDGDGVDDLIIGTFGADPSGIDGAGESYVVFGKAANSRAKKGLRARDTFDARAGNTIFDHSNVGASLNRQIAGTDNDNEVNQSFLAGFTPLPMDDNMASAEFNLSDLNGDNGFTINGIDAGDFSGILVSSAGDINSDGLDDLIIGARFADPNGTRSGESYVVFGSDNFNSSLELSDLGGTNGFTLNGIDANDYSGSSVSSAGDINGDGVDDLIIGAYNADPNGNNSGESYVVFGSDNFNGSLELSDLDGTNGFTINGIEAGDGSGFSVSNAGDVNGDGLDDLIIGAVGGFPEEVDSPGESYVVFGSDNPSSNINLGDLDGTNGFTINGIDAGGRSGRSVSGAGDVNGDGLDDLIIGALGADPSGNDGAGESYVVFGSDNPSSSINLGDLDGTNGFAISGINAGDGSGRSVSGAGDVNGDGIDDLIIGAFGADPNGNDSAGESYVVFGSDNPNSSINLGDLDGTNGFTISGIEAGDVSGIVVSSAGDVNGDGLDDLIIGASSADPNGNSSGESYVAFGSNNPSSSINLGDLDGTNGFILNGIDGGDYSGSSVSSAGDVNGDGIDDLIIGATGADPNGNESAGESYVVFGKATTSRVEEGLQALYTFDAGAGKTVFDRSNVGTPLNLQVADTDSVVWGNDGTLSIDDALITSAGAATKVYDAITATEEITIEAWVAPDNDTQTGPAQIVSLSENTVNRNFTLGQNGDAYGVRLRTTTTDDNGRPDISSPDGSLTTDLTHVVYTRESDGDVRLYLDNELDVEDTLTGKFSKWNPSHELSLANELTGDHPWAGTFDLVAIYNQSFDDSEVNQNFLAGPGASASSGGDDVLSDFQASTIAGSDGAVLPGTENLDIFALGAVAQPF